jgi:hypothetical protein
MNCIWDASGTYACERLNQSIRPEPFYAKDPETDPGCAEYGCAEGRLCDDSGDCANGLSCSKGKCRRVDPFYRDRDRREHKHGSDRDDGLREDDKMNFFQLVLSFFGYHK